MQQDMQNNRQNNNWKHRLESDTALAADEILNSGAAWDTLYERLHKPRRKKAVGYRIAAACAVAAVLCAVILQRPVKEQRTGTVKQVSGSIHTGNEIKPAQQTGIVSVPVKKTIATSVRTIKTKLKREFADTGDTVLTAPAEKNTTAQSETAIVPVVMQEEAIEPLATVQPRPKLKVVHVNELGAGSANTIHRPGTDYSVIQVGISNRTTQPTGKIGIQIPTAKTSSSN